MIERNQPRWLVFAIAWLAGAFAIQQFVPLSAPAGRLVLFGGVVLATIGFVLYRARGLTPRLASMAVSIGVVPILVLGVVNDHVGREGLFDHGDEILRGAADRSAQSVEGFLTQVLDNVRTDALDPEFGRLLAQSEVSNVDPNLLREVQVVLHSKAMRDAIFVTSVALIGIQGKIAAETRSGHVEHDEENCSIFKEAIESGAARVALERCNSNGTRDELIAVAPVRGARGAILGVIRVRYDLAVLQCLLARDVEVLGAGSFSILVDEGRTILGHAADPRLILRSITNWPDLAERIVHADEIAEVPCPVNESETKPHRAVVKPLRTRPWNVVFAQSPEAFFAPIDAQSQFRLTFAFLIIVIALLVAWLLSRRVVKPVQRLRVAAGRLSRGDLDARVYVERDDELGILAVAFNGMADRLKESLLGLRDEVKQRERVESALRANEERFRALIENSLDVIVVADVNGVITFASQNAERLFGCTESELIGARLEDFVSRDDRVMLARLLEDHDTRSIPSFAFELEDKRGGSRVVEAVLRRADDVPGVRGVIVTLRDVTDRRKLEAQLAQAQKMEGIGLLAGGIAHDFNNLLVPIFGHGEMARESVPDGHPARESLDHVLSAAESAKRLVQQLLAFGRKQTLSMRGLDLRTIVEETGSLLRRTLRDDIVLTVRCGDASMIVEADATQVRQVLVNLVINAEDAMPTGGQLDISLRFATERDVVRGRGDVVGVDDFAVIEVRDTGHGMSPETQDRIFEPFFTTKGVGRGTGLGLATAYGIVRQHRGAIRFESALGHGTAFRIFLPLSTREFVAEGVKPVESPSQVGGTVLLVEDDPRVRDLVAQVLRTHGYAVLVAESAEHAKTLASAHPTPIDLLLTDVVMPRVNGRALFEQLRERQASLHVLYMSGYSADIIARNGVLDDATSFLAKPFTTSELLHRVAEEIVKARDDVDSIRDPL